MSPETLRLLISADDSDPDAYYSPVGFNWKKEMARVRALKPEVEAILGLSVELDDQVQDASFFAQMAVTVPQENENRETAIAVAFSAFGNLFTVWSSKPELIPVPVLQSIIAAVQEHGFLYVNGESLSEPYSGENSFFQSHNWYYRFFDYL